MYKTRLKFVSGKYGASCSGYDKIVKDCNTHKCPGKLSYMVRQKKYEAKGLIRLTLMVSQRCYK